MKKKNERVQKQTEPHLLVEQRKVSWTGTKLVSAEVKRSQGEYFKSVESTRQSKSKNFVIFD